MLLVFGGLPGVEGLNLNLVDPDCHILAIQAVRHIVKAPVHRHLASGVLTETQFAESDDAFKDHVDKLNVQGRVKQHVDRLDAHLFFIVRLAL